jgi:hypothetical protein
MATQINDNVETGVDKLLSYLRGKGQVSVKTIARDLKVSEEVVQSWVDFLVEEKILGMEYKLTNPYVYLLSKEKIDTTDEKDIKSYKKEFESEAKNKNIADNKTAFLWKNHVQRELENVKSFFYEEAKKRGLAKTDALWTQYQQRILGTQGL